MSKICQITGKMPLKGKKTQKNRAKTRKKSRKIKQKQA